MEVKRALIFLLNILFLRVHENGERVFRLAMLLAFSAGIRLRYYFEIPKYLSTPNISNQ